MFLLTEGPHLFYVDPVAMVLKGEIPKSSPWYHFCSALLGSELL